MAFKNRYNDDSSLEITVKKDELLAILKKNRATHQHDFERAIHFWRGFLQSAIESVTPETCLEFPKELEQVRKHCPEVCTKEYDDVIDMFEMSIDETIILTTDAYRKFCKDEWDWKSDTYGNWYYKNLKMLEEHEASKEETQEAEKTEVKETIITKKGKKTK